MASDVKIRILAEDKARRELNRTKVSLRNLAQVAGVVTGAVFTMKKAFDFAEQGAQIERLEESGQRLASQFDQNMGDVTDAIVEASGNTIDRMTAMQAANNAMILDVAKTPEEFAKLTKSAVALGRATGRTASQSINDLTTGIGRQSRMILDNLGIVLDAEKTYGAYAEQLGKTSDQLTDTEKKEALLNKAVEASQPLLDEQGELVADSASEFERAKAEWTDFTSEVKKGTLTAILPGVKAFNKKIEAIEELKSAQEEGTITQEEYNVMANKLRFLQTDEVLEELRKKHQELREAVERTRKILDLERGGLQGVEEDAGGASESIDKLTIAMKDLTEAEIGREMLDALQTSFEEGQISAKEYKQEAIDIGIEYLKLGPRMAGANAELAIARQEFEKTGDIEAYLETLEAINSTVDKIDLAKLSSIPNIPNFMGGGSRAPKGAPSTSGGQQAFARGGTLSGNMAVVGEEGFEFAFKKGDDWVIVPHEQSKALASMGIMPGAGFAVGGALGGRGNLIPGFGGTPITATGGSFQMAGGRTFTIPNLNLGQDPSVGGIGGRGGSGPSRQGTTSASTQQATAQAATSAATTAATSVGEQTTQAVTRSSQQVSQRFLQQFSQEQRRERQPLMKTLDEINVRLKRLPQEIVDALALTTEV